MFVKQEILLLFFCLKTICYGEFTMPEVTLEAFKPKGFRASIPALPGIQMFAFHANVNKDISQIDQGTYFQDFTSSSNNRWSYHNEDLTLKQGDVVNYWVFVQFEKLGYRKDNQKWNVTELVELKDITCDPSPSAVSGQSIICKNGIILEDNFNEQQINEKNWVIEEYIPCYGSEPDYEFVSYRKKICRIVNNKLEIKPIAAQTENDVEGELDLRNGCTRQSPDECYHKSQGVFIRPPVTSGRIVSTVNFRYAKVEIKAKLPAGDWIYPQMYLEQVGDPKRKLWIGYSRGNDKLVGSNGEDIGSTLLFGGPVINPREPERSGFLRSTKSTNPFTSQTHTYTVIWSQNRIVLQHNGVEYGSIPGETMKEIKFAEDDMVRLVLGVGVGGINDFPDDFQSGEHKKPWKNQERRQVKEFFSKRNAWIQTWARDRPAFQIDSVKVTAL